MKKQLWILTSLVLLSSYSCNQEPEYKGYTLVSKEFVQEVNADC